MRIRYVSDRFFEVFAMTSEEGMDIIDTQIWVLGGHMNGDPSLYTNFLHP